jgi:hypothetical protein
MNSIAFVELIRTLGMGGVKPLHPMAEPIL